MDLYLSLTFNEYHHMTGIVSQDKTDNRAEYLVELGLRIPPYV